MASRAASGSPRGRAFSGRRDDAKDSGVWDGVSPERTVWERPARPEPRGHETAVQDARDGTGRQRAGHAHPPSHRSAHVAESGCRVVESGVV